MVGEGARWNTFALAYSCPTTVILGAGLIIQVHFLESSVTPPVRILLFYIQQLLVPVITAAIVRATGLLHYTVNFFAATNRQTRICVAKE